MCGAAAQAVCSSWPCQCLVSVAASAGNIASVSIPFWDTQHSTAVYKSPPFVHTLLFNQKTCLPCLRRDKEHSTIIYESPQPSTPLLRLSWNKQDPRYIAAFAMDSPKVLVLDIRYPTLPVAQLQRHQVGCCCCYGSLGTCFHLPAVRLRLWRCAVGAAGGAAAAAQGKIGR